MGESQRPHSGLETNKPCGEFTEKGVKGREEGKSNTEEEEEETRTSLSLQKSSRGKKREQKWAELVS